VHYLATHAAFVLELLGQHVALTGGALAIAAAIALPLGAYAAHRPRVGGALLAALGVVYTIPSLALFALLIPLLGLGVPTALTVLAIYAQMILVRNVVAGLAGVPPELIDAARGLGMTAGQSFRRVELPQALPVIVSGVRIAVVSTIAIANLAAWIDAGGLGVLLFDGLRTDDNAKLAIGAGASAALAIAADLALRAAERTAQRRAGRFSAGAPLPQ
jgi:osmoprotectant transport system permease protein